MSSSDPNRSPTQQQTSAFTLPSVGGALDIDSMASRPSSFPQQQINPISGIVGGTSTATGGGVIGGSGDHPRSSVASMMAPKFPPPNFEVPDISFCNSLGPNVDFNPSFFASPAVSASTSAMYQHGTNTHPLSSMATSSVAPPGVMMQQAGYSMGGTDGMMMSPAVPAAMGPGPPVGPGMSMMGGPSAIVPGGGATPLASNACTSPPGTSSSEDSDDLPLAQIASMKRAADAANATAPSTVVVQSSSATDTAAGSTTETASQESSPTPGKKAKVSKRKKKKDPNEPTKPVSAYALFFRDTQASIKNHNPSASFGEVSKIVASMWDQLDPENKDVYKKKTEMAKKLYLKQLAAYRASQVSQSSAEDAEKSPSPPGLPMASSNMVANAGVVHPTGGQGVSVMSPPHMSGGPMLHHHHHHIPHNMMPPPPQQQQQQQFFHPQDSLLQQQQQHHHHQQMMQHDPHQQQQQQQQMVGMQPPPYSPPHDQHQHHHHPHHHMQQHHPQQQQHSPPQHHHHQQQQQQQPMGVYHQNPPHSSPPFTTSANTPTNNINNSDHTNSMMGYRNSNMVQDNTATDVNFTPCTRNGCINQAQENPAWDSEFCSHDCVITHCRDIFTNWVGARSGSSSFPVK